MSKRMELAKDYIAREGCTVCAVTASGAVFRDCGATVRPLYRIFTAHRAELCHAAVADRVIGRAAASLLCAAGVREAYGYLMSETGRALLERHGVAAGYAALVPYIENRRKDGMCPMERTVDGVDDLEECVRLLGEFIAKTPQPK